jgi:3-oxoacyl-[acyl-carrier-protein] synthase II
VNEAPEITGWGVASALGIGRKVFREALLRGESGIAEVRRFDTSAFTTSVGALVVGYEEDHRDPTVLCHEFGILAARDALDHANLDLREVRATRIAMTVGASLFGDHATHDLALGLAQELGIRGPAITISTACTSSTQAVGFGADLIHRGFADVVLAGGIDALTPALFAGFHALGVLSRAPCTPFATQLGTTLGEGAGFLVLERVGFRAAHSYARLHGYGLSGDAYHETSPEPRGRGVAAAIRGALDDAGARESDIGYFNAHGTGTAANDTAEWCAVQSVFGPEAARSLPLSSSKGHLGHAQSAAGVLEVITTLECMNAGVAPTTAGFEAARPGGPPSPVGSKRPSPLAYEIALSNNSAFGGNNCALVFGPAKPIGHNAPGARRVFLHGAGAVCSGVRSLADLETFDESEVASRDQSPDLGLSAALPRADLRGLDRATELLTAAVVHALGDAGVKLKGSSRERTGLIAGALRASPDSLGRFHSSLEARGLGKPDTTAFAQVLPSAAQSGCAKAIGIRGPQSTITVGRGSGLFAAIMSAWMLAHRRDADRMVAAGVDARAVSTNSSASPDAACAIVLTTTSTPVEVSGIGLAGPGRLEEAIAEARRRSGVDRPFDLIARAPSGCSGMRSTSSAFSLALAFDALRSGRARSALVASDADTASAAMVLTYNEAGNVR